MRWISAIAMAWAVFLGLGCSSEAEPREEQQRQLADNGTVADLQVTIEARFLRVEDNFLRDIGVNLTALSQGQIGGSQYVNGENAAGGAVIANSGIFGGAENSDIYAAGNLNPERPNPLWGSRSSNAQVFPATAPGRFYANENDSGYFGRVENLLNLAIPNGSYFNGSGGLTFATAILDDTDVNVILNAAQQQQNSDVISAPRILAANNQQATIITTQYVANLQDFEAEIANQARQIDPTIEYLRTGIALNLRPQVSSDRSVVTMEFAPIKAAIGESRIEESQSGPVTIQLPVISVNRVTTSVQIPDGGSVLIGGIHNRETNTDTEGVPIFGDIPLLGRFFTDRHNQKDKRHLMILVTANIINQPG